jgi:hypothetical protein
MPSKHQSYSAPSASRMMRVTLCSAIVATAVGCGKDGPTAPPDRAPNFVRLESESGDYIGGGQPHEYTKKNAVLKASVSKSLIVINVEGDQYWRGEFAVPAGADVKKGTYAGATMFAITPKATPGINWTGEGRGCGGMTGSFTVDNVAYVRGVLDAIDLHFEQHCDGRAPALRGTIHWRADDPTEPPPPEPIPSNLWKPDPSAVPASGTYVLTASDPGEWVGQGQLRVYTPPSIIVSNTGTKITVVAGGYTGNFITMVGVVPIKPGYYASVRKAPWHNPVRAGVDWSGDGRGCGQLAGWLAIDRIVYTGATMTALEMRFEQRCDGRPSALHGAIRWAAD